MMKKNDMERKHKNRNTVKERKTMNITIHQRTTLLNRMVQKTTTKAIK